MDVPPTAPASVVANTLAIAHLTLTPRLVNPSFSDQPAPVVALDHELQSTQGIIEFLRI